jgi:hypothetical protein
MHSKQKTKTRRAPQAIFKIRAQLSMLLCIAVLAFYFNPILKPAKAYLSSETGMQSKSQSVSVANVLVTRLSASLLREALAGSCHGVYYWNSNCGGHLASVERVQDWPAYPFARDVTLTTSRPAQLNPSHNKIW